MANIIFVAPDELIELTEKYRVARGYKTTSQAAREIYAQGLYVKGYVYSGETKLKQGKPAHKLLTPEEAEAQRQTIAAEFWKSLNLNKDQ